MFYNKHCLPLRLNASLPDYCHENVTNKNDDEAAMSKESFNNILMLFDVWPALSVILYILGKINIFKLVIKKIGRVKKL